MVRYGLALKCDDPEKDAEKEIDKCLSGLLIKWPFNVRIVRRDVGYYMAVIDFKVSVTEAEIFNFFSTHYTGLQAEVRSGHETSTIYKGVTMQ